LLANYVSPDKQSVQARFFGSDYLGFEFFTHNTLSAGDRRFILEDVTRCEIFRLTQTFCDCPSHHEYTYHFRKETDGHVCF